MKFTLLTYNVLFYRAFIYLNNILKKYQPDIVCLQEVETTEDNLNSFKDQSYALADYANCFISFGKIYGVATFYNKKRFSLIKSKTIPLGRSLYENFSLLLQMFKKRGIRRTMLITDFYLKSNKKVITFYNIHLCAISLNNLRLKQLNMINFEELNNQNPLIITGDFNFPIERKKLENIMNKYKLKEATNKLFYTHRYPKNPKEYQYRLLQRLFGKITKKFWGDKFKLDYIYYRGLKNLTTQRLDVSLSDHYPILAEFEL